MCIYKEEDRDVHRNNMAGGIGVERAVTGNKALKTLSDDWNAPIAITTTWVFAEIPIFLPQLFSNLFQSPHYSIISININM